MDTFSTLNSWISLCPVVKDDSQVFTFSIRNYMYKCIYICPINALLDALIKKSLLKPIFHFLNCYFKTNTPNSKLISSSILLFKLKHEYYIL